MTQKCAILSDIHGNVEALRAVLSATRQAQVDTYIIAGDLMGYYFRLPEVMDEIRSLNAHIIRGNHEDIFVTWRDVPDQRDVLEKKYGSSFARNQKLLSQDDMNFLMSLPSELELEIAGKRTLICHGSPWDKDEYVYPDATTQKVDKFFSCNKDMIIFGHTHYPVIWENNGHYAVNPGSVGQPRDRKGGACWALWDLEKNTVSLEREFYDTAPVITDCEEFCPSISYLKDILLATPEKDARNG